MRRYFTLFAALLSGALATGGAIAGPALLLDAQNGKVLYAEDQDDLWHPASLTKIMTAYLTFEAIKAGKLTLESKIVNSEAASLQPPSKIGLPVGAEMSVDLALRALIVKSANDVAMMLAEAIGGSEQGFVDMMNATARKLGMTRTRFVNPNGLPAPEQVTTARDLAKLSRAVMANFPEHAHYWSMADMRIGKIYIPTHNGLLKSFEGADGLKTGFICDSGYNIVATATRDGRRLVAVVLGEATGRDRNIRAASLLDHGFQIYGWKEVLGAATLDRMPLPPETRPVMSVRSEVMNFSCNGRRHRSATAVAKARQTRAKATKAAAAGGAGAPQTTGSTASVKANPAPKPKAAVAATNGAPSAPTKPAVTKVQQ
jgi:D-alanyl-D-alanine carboxypeptidase